MRSSRRQLHVLEGREDRQEVVRLEDEADGARAPLRERAFPQSFEVLAGDLDGPGAGTIETGDEVQERRLAGAGRAHQRLVGGRGNVEIQVLEHAHFFPTAGVRLGHASQLHDRLVRHHWLLSLIA
jgi:hypothetical protein